MLWLAIVGGILVASIAAASWYDHRQRRRGVRTGISRYSIEQKEAMNPYGASPGEGRPKEDRPGR